MRMYTNAHSMLLFIDCVNDLNNHIKSKVNSERLPWIDEHRYLFQLKMKKMVYA